MTNNIYSWRFVASKLWRSDERDICTPFDADFRDFLIIRRHYNPLDYGTG
jgi:hypothetical protein